MKIIDVIKETPTRKQLELRNKPCHDCAVTCGFYKEYSDALKELLPEEQLEKSKEWFCHNNCDLACRGNADNLNLEW